MALALVVSAFTATTATVAVTEQPASASVAYYLPYPSGTTYGVTQGPLACAPSHCSGGNSAYAYDFGMGADDPIVASAAGILVYRQSHAELGNMVWIQHSDGKCTMYAHMSGFSPAVNGMAVNSSSVAQGQVIGYAGSTGSSTTGVHLHFGKTNCAWVTESIDFVESGWTSQNPGSGSGGSGSDPVNIPHDFTATSGGMGDLVAMSRATDGTPYIYTLASNGAGFSAPALWSHPTTGWSNWDDKVWLTGDMGGNGRADLIGISKATDGTPYIYVFPSTGSSFSAGQLWAHPTTGWSDWDNKRWLAADLGGDGKAELIGISRGTDGTPYVNVFVSFGAGFSAPELWAHPTTGWSDWDNQHWLAIDVGGNKKTDLVGIARGGDGTPYIHVFTSSGSSFGAGELWAHPTTGWANWNTKRWL